MNRNRRLRTALDYIDAQPCNFRHSDRETLLCVDQRFPLNEACARELIATAGDHPPIHKLPAARVYFRRRHPTICIMPPITNFSNLPRNSASVIDGPLHSSDRRQKDLRKCLWHL